MAYTPEYWNAFAARLVKYGLGRALARIIIITGNEAHWSKLNEFLREAMPDIAEDKVAIKWYKKYKKELSNRKAEWNYGTCNFRH